MAKRVSKLDRDLLKQIIIKTSNSNQVFNLSANYPKKVKTLTGDYKIRNTTLNFSITKSPTSNCQVSSIIQFGYYLSYFTNKYIEKEKRLSKEEKYNSKIRKLAIYKIIAALTVYWHKTLFSIDIKQCYLEGLDNIYEDIFTKRIKCRDVKYISTNGSKMMYSLVQLDKDKLKRFWVNK